MNAEQLNAIKERAEKATPGPWTYDGCDVLGNDESIIYANCHGDVQINESDADFIAHAREDIPALVAEVERLETALYRIGHLQNEGWEWHAHQKVCDTLGIERGHFDEYPTIDEKSL